MSAATWMSKVTLLRDCAGRFVRPARRSPPGLGWPRARCRGPGWAGWGPGRWADAVSAAAVAASRLGVLGPPPAPPACEIRLSGREHSRARDRAVIAGHYDLPVSFYRLILDPAMAYSCGYWTSDDPGYGRRRPAGQAGPGGRQARARPGDLAADLGCGWGSLTVHAAQHRPARITRSRSRPNRAVHRERLRGLVRQTGHGCDPGLPGYGGRPVRRDRLPRDGRARRAPTATRPSARRCATCCAPAGRSSSRCHGAGTPRRRPLHRVVRGR